ncbi:MAG: response regulator [Candidatus Omnitrophota bacterium]
MSEIRSMIKILLVEDNLDDVEITRRALKDAKVLNKLWIVRDGEEALDFLYRKNQYKDPDSSPRPGLIMLDINLPKINGLEVLKRIKQNSKLKRIPVVVLTVSKRDEDIIRAYDCNCNSFIQKPVEFEKFVDVIRQIELYWGLLNLNSPNGVERK